MRCATPRFHRRLTPGERRTRAYSLTFDLNCLAPAPGWSIWRVEDKEPYRANSRFGNAGYAVLAFRTMDGLRFSPYRFGHGALGEACTDSYTARQIVERAAQTAQEAGDGLD